MRVWDDDSGREGAGQRGGSGPQARAVSLPVAGWWVLTCQSMGHAPGSQAGRQEGAGARQQPAATAWRGARRRGAGGPTRSAPVVTAVAQEGGGTCEVQQQLYHQVPAGQAVPVQKGCRRHGAGRWFGHAARHTTAQNTQPRRRPGLPAAGAPRAGRPGQRCSRQPGPRGPLSSAQAQMPAAPASSGHQATLHARTPATPPPETKPATRGAGGRKAAASRPRVMCSMGAGTWPCSCACTVTGGGGSGCEWRIGFRGRLGDWGRGWDRQSGGLQRQEAGARA